MPCSRSHRSGLIDSTSSSSAAVRGSVPRISRFSSSDSVIVRRLSSSSISRASKNVERALLRDLGVVVEDDRRAEHDLRVPRLAHQDREETVVDARRRRTRGPTGAGPAGRRRHRPSTRSSRCAATAARRSQSGRVVPGSRAAGVPLPTSIRTSATPYGEGGRVTVDVDGHPDRFTGAHQPADDLAPFVEQVLVVLAAGQLPVVAGAGRLVGQRHLEGRLALDGLVPRDVDGVVGLEPRHLDEALGGVRPPPDDRCTCRQRTSTSRRARRPSTTTSVARLALPLRRVEARPRPRASARPTGSAPGSWASWPGRGRGRSPRRGPRPPPPGSVAALAREAVIRRPP